MNFVEKKGTLLVSLYTSYINLFVKIGNTGEGMLILQMYISENNLRTHGLNPFYQVTHCIPLIKYSLQVIIPQ